MGREYLQYFGENVYDRQMQLNTVYPLLLKRAARRFIFRRVFLRYCSKVLVIDEAEKELTLCDERLEAAVRKTGEGLIVLDPLQAYLGCDMDMHRANKVHLLI